MSRATFGAAVGLIVLTAAAGASAAEATNPKEVARGKYLVDTIPCTDCHTPGGLTGKPDMKRYLGGSDVGFPMPDLGTFYGSNLTPDKETGLGNWSNEEIARAIRTGERPDGRILAPIMPVGSLKNLTQADAMAIAAYLKTLPPVKNKVSGPFGPTEKPVGLVMPVIPADVYMKLPKPPAPPPQKAPPH